MRKGCVLRSPKKEEEQVAETNPGFEINLDELEGFLGVNDIHGEDNRLSNVIEGEDEEQQGRQGDDEDEDEDAEISYKGHEQQHMPINPSANCHSGSACDAAQFLGWDLSLFTTNNSLNRLEQELLFPTPPQPSCWDNPHTTCSCTTIISHNSNISIDVKKEPAAAAHAHYFNEEEEEEEEVHHVVELESKASLNLNLNYQQVLEAWSNQGSLWADAPHHHHHHHPFSMSKNYLGEVPNLEEERRRRESSVLRYKEKRQSRLFSKKIRYGVRKLNADKRPRLKGRFMKGTPEKRS